MNVSFSISNSEAISLQLVDLELRESLAVDTESSEDLYLPFPHIKTYHTLAPLDQDPLVQEEYARFERQLQLIMYQAPDLRQEEPKPARRQLKSHKCKKQKECSICQQPCVKGGRIGKLKCRHVYHHECISEWLTEHSTCPLCRREV